MAEEFDAEREAVRLLVMTVRSIGDQLGWRVVMAALPTVLTPLLVAHYGTERAASVYRDIADAVPGIVAGWEARERFEAMPAAGRA
ncbi:MAG: hypothetical protein IVW56_09650 [Candidatus Binataceae bacterium]|nr:hypothetical protein [Candidatus Binataceae bacterium]